MGAGPKTRNKTQLHKIYFLLVLFHPCHDDGRDDEDWSRKESPSNGCLFDCLGREGGRKRRRKRRRKGEREEGGGKEGREYVTHPR